MSVVFIITHRPKHTGVKETVLFNDKESYSYCVRQRTRIPQQFMRYFFAYKNMQFGKLSILVTLGRSRSMPAPEQHPAEFRLFYSDRVFFLSFLLPSFFLSFMLSTFLSCLLRCFLYFFLFFCTFHPLFISTFLTAYK